MQKQYNTPATEILSLSPAGIICTSGVTPSNRISSNIVIKGGDNGDDIINAF